MTIELVKYPEETDWILCKRITLGTVGKDSLKPPSSDLKHSLLKARHSPIRILQYYFLLKDIPYWVSVHLCRHVHALPFVKTQRTDRTGIDRTKLPQDSPVNMWLVVNAEELQVIANKRLCKMASEQTRDIVSKMCQLAEEATPELKGLLVPMCVRNGGICYEINGGCKRNDL